MNPSKVGLNKSYHHFHQLTDNLLHTSKGGTPEKISDIAIEWADFVQNHRSSILLDRECLEKVAEIKANLDTFPQLEEALNGLLAEDQPFPIDLLPADLLRVVMSFLNLKELMQVSWVSKNFRRHMLEIQTWRSNHMFQKLLRSGKRDGRVARDQFTKVLRGFQQQAITPRLATEFTTRAGHDVWRFYLEEIDKDGRDLLYQLLKEQDLSSMQFLYLPGYNWLDKDNLNFEFFLKKCPNLAGLHVGGGQTFITDSILKGIAERYPELTHFNCENSSLVTGSYLNSWPATKIETLELGGSPKFQAGHLSANVAKFPELKRLLLFNLRLTDEDIASLAKLNKLEDLNLSGNPNLTDATLAVLEKLPSLKIVNLKGVKNITSAGLRALRASRPDLSLIHD